MALTVGQITYGFQVITGTNDSLDFKIGAGAQQTATLNPGYYSAKGFATEVSRALNATDSTDFATTCCTVSLSTLKFTIASIAANFTLMFGTGTHHTLDCGQLLAFSEADTSGATNTYTSTTTIGASSPTNATLWTLAEPNDYRSPVTAAALGTAASLTQRKRYLSQTITDGGTIEQIYWSEVKQITIGFRALTSAEQTKTEAFLDWIGQGAPFTWQPDSTSANALILVPDASSLTSINNDFEWLTRSETTYGRIRFLEDTSR